MTKLGYSFSFFEYPFSFNQFYSSILIYSLERTTKSKKIKMKQLCHGEFDLFVFTK